MKRVFVDLDGVLANIHKEIGYECLKSEKPLQIYKKGFYENLEVMPYAVNAIKELLMINEIDLWIATKIPTGNTYAATEKLQWVNRYFPELKDKVFITPEKTLLKGDFLIDDDPRWEKFDGTFILFDSRNPVSCWKKVLKQIKSKLKNNLEVELKIDYDKGEYLLINQSSVSISSLLCENYSTHTSFDGDCSHISNTSKQISNIGPKKSVVVATFCNFPEKGIVFTLKDILFQDGQKINKVELTPY